ncbi:MAG: hypothetical protein DDT30_01802 [Dehalococcoidia bacterium]|nr:hypothetical protein [Bacillota bacterium]MBT9143580.1 hypothetical protein [Bacillota bacterium]
MDSAKQALTAGASVKILGSGCAKCIALGANAKVALEQLGIDTTIDHVADFAQIAAYGVMATPALVVDGPMENQTPVMSDDHPCAGGRRQGCGLWQGVKRRRDRQNIAGDEIGLLPGRHARPFE